MEDEVRAGLFDGAEIAISFVELWVQTADPVLRGTLGETTPPARLFPAEFEASRSPRP